MSKIFLNGRLIPEGQAKVSVLDRGFLYGDGVYETVRVYDGKIFRAEAHWRRLDRSLAGIRLKIPWRHDSLTRACQKTLHANALKECLVRVTISRGTGKLGYDPASCGRPTLAVIAQGVRQDLPALWRNGVSIALVNVRRNSPLSLNPAIKSTNCLNGIFAKMESLERGAFEGVFLNLEGYLAEGTISNIFIAKGGILRTPDLSCGLLDGVTRGALVEAARKAGIEVLETRIKPFEVLHADEVFLTSTTMEAMPVVQVDSKTIGDGKPGPLTRTVHAKLRALIQKELKLPASFLSY